MRKNEFAFIREHPLLFPVVLFLLIHPIAYGASEVTVAGKDIVVRDEREGFSYRVPPPPGAAYRPEIQGIFRFAHEPFGGVFTGRYTFLTTDLTVPHTMYFFSYFAYPEYRIFGDGSYDSLGEMLADMKGTGESPEKMSPEDRARITSQYRELRDNARSTTDPNEMLVSFRRIAERRWNNPSIMDFSKNGGDEFITFFRDAVITTRQASLPSVDDGALGTRLEFRINSDQIPMGRPFIDLSENALYFAHGPRVVKIGAMDFSPRSGEEIFAVLNEWREAIVKANPAPESH